MTTKEEVLQNCTVEGTVVKLPDMILERKLYQDVAKSLELIGGKWKGGKVFGFVFQTDPTDLLEQIANGEKRNLKKEFQFFATPDDLADKMVNLALQAKPINGANTWDSAYNLTKILEPSAGQGAIIDAIHRAFNTSIVIYAFELMDINREILKKKYAELPVRVSKEPDFLNYSSESGFMFDLIIANPPFSKNQDIDHIFKMYEVCKPNGVIVTICSNHWENSTNKKEVKFANWLGSLKKIEMHDIPNGTFKDSSTMAGGKIIVINK